MIGVIESLLFVRGEDGLSLKDLVTILELNENEVVRYLDELKISLDNDSRGIFLDCLNGQYRFVTKPCNSVYLKRMLENPIVQKLSQAAMETLVIIAYKQPVTKVEVNEIRGVNSDGTIRNLIAKSLIKECGVLEVAGRPNLYETTNEFLDLFKLSSIDDLPAIENFSLDEEVEHNLFELRYQEDVNDNEESK